ncbi:MAG: hypothetical protein QF554_02735 [Dehalococcoidia bacterium]|nr:hypothetical protein [Dehalococcoidia bacterium]
MEVNLPESPDTGIWTPITEVVGARSDADGVAPLLSDANQDHQAQRQRRDDDEPAGHAGRRKSARSISVPRGVPSD